MNTLASPDCNAYVEVTLDQLKPYIFNCKSQHYRNPDFDDLLSSIEDNGLIVPLTISLRHPALADSHYVITDGGKTRLEILHILFEKYTALAKEANLDKQTEKCFEYEKKAQTFNTLVCIFEPWISESHILMAHMSESCSRGSMLFVERALMIEQFRLEYRKEDRARAMTQGEIFEDKPLTIRALAERITAQGWTVSSSHLSRFEYAANLLLDAFVSAFNDKIEEALSIQSDVVDSAVKGLLVE
jgi:hypothetical protein